jgi:hypothetical protein
LDFDALCLLYLHRIKLLILPPHSTHILQAVDLAITSPLKNYFKQALLEQVLELPIDVTTTTPKRQKKITSGLLRENLIKAFLVSATKASTIMNIRSGFRKAGMVQIDSTRLISNDLVPKIPENLGVPANTRFSINSTILNDDVGLERISQQLRGHGLEDTEIVSYPKIIRRITTENLEDGFLISPVPQILLETAFQSHYYLYDGNGQ